MDWQASMSWDVAQKRAAILAKIRQFFVERNVLEVETPAMCQSTVTDVYLDPVSTRYQFLSEGEQTLYFQTSPEYGMKRLLASGYQCIYQICKAYRNEPYGRYHNPEFTMLEWYRLNYDQFQLIDEVDALLQRVLNTQFADKLSYQEVFKQYVAIDPLETTIDECLAFISLQGKMADWLELCDDLDTLLQFIFCECIESYIGQDRPCFIYNFPASQASLAKINEIDDRVAERFECYYRGIELVNGFHELTDPLLQHDRFLKDNMKRKALNLENRELDKRFLAALESGLPECSGVALGIDRLIMLAVEADHISEVVTFSIERA